MFMLTPTYAKCSSHCAATFFRTFRLVTLAVVILAGARDATAARTFYCDPAAGNTATEDGSSQNPWGTLQSVFAAGKIQRRQYAAEGVTNPEAPVAQGDTLILRSGYHGCIDYDGWWNLDGAITVRAEDGATPTLGYWDMRGAAHWTLSGLTFQMNLYGSKGPIVRFIEYGGNAHDIVIENCAVRSAPTQATANWAASDWVTNAQDGIECRADNSIVRKNTVEVVSFGILAGGNNTRVEHNIVNLFRRDGLRYDGPGDGMIWQYNRVTNSKNVDGNHDDGMQVYAAGRTVRNMVIRGNVFISWTEPDMPHAGSFQGIFCGGGDYRGWTVENNLIVNGHANGIRISSPIDCTIVNNTLVQVDGGLHAPNIYMDSEGTQNTVVRNNIASGFPTPASGLQVDHNLMITGSDSASLFVNPAGGNYRLKPSSPAVDQGSTDGAPQIDADRKPRDANPDLGCYEYRPGDPDNYPPVLETIGNRSVAANERLSFTVSADDPEGDTLTFSASGLPGGATFSGQTFTWTPTAAQAGTHTVTFVASDGQTQDSETITITVAAAGANAPPVLAAIGAKSTRENERLAFSVTATDADGDAIAYSANNLPTGASFSGQSFSWTPGYDQAGSHQVTFVASDGQAQDSETVAISVANVNRPPVLSAIGDRSVDENSTVAFTVSATDPDGDSLTYSATGVPSGASFSGGSFSWTPSSSQIGAYDIAFTVSDGQLQDNETISLVVASTSPDATAPAVTSVSPEPDAIQVSLNHLIKLHVTDSGGGIDAQSVTIRLNDQVIYQGDTNLHTSAYGRCSRAGHRYDHRFIFQANELFECDRALTVKVDAADRAGNGMDTYSYSFLTEMRAFGNNHMASSAADSGPKGRPATVRDAAGNIWAVWHAGATGARDIYVARLTAGAHAFAAPVRLTTAGTDQCNPHVALAPDGRLYVVWQDSARGNWDIFISSSADGVTWSRAAQVTNSDGNETNPVLVVDRQSPSQAHVVWQDDRNGNSDIYVATSTNAFSGSTVTRVTTDAADQLDPDATVDGNSTILIVWTDWRNGNADIYGASSGASWANVPVVTAPGAQTACALAAEPAASVLHLLWTDDQSGNRDIYYAASDGLPADPLSGTSIIDDTSGAAQFAPTIACVDGRRVFACWEDLRHVGQSGDSDLFMADLGTGAIGTNILVGDDGTNSSQSEPMVGVDGYGNPYVVWTDGRGGQDEIYYAATTFIDPVPLDSQQVIAAAGATIGTDPAQIDSPDDVSIIVPAGACQFDARITIAEILNPQVSPVACLGSYDFGPSGIDFDAPVTVTIPYEYAGGAGSPKPYWYDSLTGALTQQGITDVENLTISPSLSALRFKTTHFTPFYLVAGDADVGLATTEITAGGCSVSTTGGGSVRDLLVPYGLVAIVMVALRRTDRRRRRLRANTMP